jgi:hypothetical protein
MILGKSVDTIQALIRQARMKRKSRRSIRRAKNRKRIRKSAIEIVLVATELSCFHLHLFVGTHIDCVK